MAIDLSGPRVKLKRAREHRHTLKREIGPIFQGKRYPIKLSAKLNPDSGYHVFRVVNVPHDLMLRVAAILGDVVHDLRSALDQLAWQLVLNHSGRPRGPKAPKQKINIEFPIKSSRKKLTSGYTYNKVAPFDRTILDAAQPYYRSKYASVHGLAILQQLSNRDKHRMLNPMLLSTRIITVEGTMLENAGIFDIDWIPTDTRKSLKVGADVLRCRLPSHIDHEVEVAGYLAPNITLTQGNMGVLHGVHVMTRAVEDVIKAFASNYGV